MMSTAAVTIFSSAASVIQSSPRSGLAEHAREDGVDVLRMKGVVEERRERRRREISRDLGIGLQEIEEARLSFPDRHRVPLHRAIGVLAAHPGLRQREEHALRMNEPA